MIWSTYFGGDGNDFAVSGNPITTTYTPSGTFAITGHTASSSSTFPVLTPTGSYSQPHYATSPPLSNEDAFVAVFSNEFEQSWTTFFGGEDFDQGTSLTYDSNNNLYVTGFSKSASATPPCSTTTMGEFPICDDNSTYFFTDQFDKGNDLETIDAYICQFNNSYELTWSTYIGGTRSDYGNSIIVDENSAENGLYFYGTTYSPKDDVTSTGASFNNANFPIVQRHGYHYQNYDLLGIGDDQLSFFNLGTVVSVNEVNFQIFDFVIYPNPVVNKLFVEFNWRFKTFEKLTFEFFDLLGNKILEVPVTQAHLEIDTSELCSGIYFVRLSNNLTVQKLIIQK